MQKDTVGGQARRATGSAAGGWEMDSPRVRAFLRATSGRRKRAPDVKSFSHELNPGGAARPGGPPAPPASPKKGGARAPRVRGAYRTPGRSPPGLDHGIATWHTSDG